MAGSIIDVDVVAGEESTVAAVVAVLAAAGWARQGNLEIVELLARARRLAF